MSVQNLDPRQTLGGTALAQREWMKRTTLALLATAAFLSAACFGVNDGPEGPCGFDGCQGPCAGTAGCLLRPNLGDAGLADADSASECGSDGCQGSCASLPRCATVTYDTSACTGKIYEALAGLKLARVVDYLELRDEVNPEDIKGGTGGPSQVYSRVMTSEGEICKTASDVAACTEAVGAVRLGQGKASWIVQHPAGIYIPASHMYLVYTQGDTIGVVSNKTELDALVGSVDNVKEAALYVTLHLGHSLDCTRPNAHRAATGYDILSRSGSNCGTGISENHDFVSLAGKAETLATTLVAPGTPCP